MNASTRLWIPRSENPSTSASISSSEVDVRCDTFTNTVESAHSKTMNATITTAETPPNTSARLITKPMSTTRWRTIA